MLPIYYRTPGEGIRPLLRLPTEWHGVQPDFSDPFLSLVVGTLDKLSEQLHVEQSAPLCAAALI